MRIRPFLYLIFAAAIFQSCRLFNPSVMLRTQNSYNYDTGVDTVEVPYIIQKNDILYFRLFPNDGYKIIDMISSEDGRSNMAYGSQNTLPYLVEANGMVNLPIIGRIEVAGLDLKEAELMLEDKFRNYYNDPYVTLRVENRRILVFPGEGGAAKVVPINNENITILEALALAGGISNGGKAHKIKVIRGDLKDPEIYRLDLSTVEGLKEADLYFVKANDIVYVEPSYFVGQKLVYNFTTLLGLISSTLVTYVLVTQFGSGE